MSSCNNCPHRPYCKSNDALLQLAKFNIILDCNTYVITLRSKERSTVYTSRNWGTIFDYLNEHMDLTLEDTLCILKFKNEYIGG